jgi:hypothetical protein
VRRSPVLTATVLPFVVDPKCRRVCIMEGKLKQGCTTRTRKKPENPQMAIAASRIRLSPLPPRLPPGSISTVRSLSWLRPRRPAPAGRSQSASAISNPVCHHARNRRHRDGTAGLLPIGLMGDLVSISTLLPLRSYERASPLYALRSRAFRARSSRRRSMSSHLPARIRLFFSFSACRSTPGSVSSLGWSSGRRRQAGHRLTYVRSTLSPSPVPLPRFCSKSPRYPRATFRARAHLSRRKDYPSAAFPWVPQLSDRRMILYASPWLKG